VRRDEKWSRGEYVFVAISDTGTGMTSDVLKHAFRGPSITNQGGGRGSGLGLSQVYGFVKQSAVHVDFT